ncbi:MAG: hypothetical protein H6713_07635 [Myxococcales bacterium]|nr:hypothetical protein [Myxococcales bacterium]MCB9749863.1 hypothetical protein [Myxococcales bacterium]
MANARSQSSGRRVLIQLARVVALTSALAVIGGIVVSDVIAAEPGLEDDEHGLRDVIAPPGAASDPLWDSGGPLALTSRFGMPTGPIAPRYAMFVDTLEPGGPLTAELKFARAEEREQQRREAERAAKRKQRMSKKFKFGRMDAY